MSLQKTITLTVNNVTYTHSVEPRLLLSDFLRDRLNLTGTHVGCEHGICGACTITLNGNSIRSCLTLAVQADGADITTVEGMGSPESLSELQNQFQQHHALQCGFCTPGMLATCEDMLRKYPLTNEQDIRDGLSGNLCRCTGYQHIVDAVQAVIDKNGK